jgi:hypothetical protein
MVVAGGGCDVSPRKMVSFRFGAGAVVMTIFMAISVGGDSLKTECSRSSSRNVRQILNNVCERFYLRMLHHLPLSSHPGIL